MIRFTTTTKMELDMDDMDMAPFEDEAEESDDGKENDDANENGGDDKSKKSKSAKPKKASTRIGTLDEMANRYALEVR